MAQHFYNWTGYNHGDSPHGVSYPWNSATKSIDTTTFGYPVFKESHSGNQEVPTIFDAIGSPSGTVEVLMRCRTTYVDTGSGLDYQNIIYLRGSGGSGSKNGYTVNMLRGLYLNTEGYIGNSSITFGAGANFSWSANTWYWFRARMEGNTIYYKAWLDGTSEPPGWQGTGGHTGLSSGWVGFGSWSGNGTRYVSQIGIGTNGDSAPSGPLNTTLSVNNASIAAVAPEPKIKVIPVIEAGGIIYGGWGAHRVAGSYYGVGSNRTAVRTTLEVDDAIIDITSDEVPLAQKNVLVLDDADILIASAKPTLIQNAVLGIDDSVLGITSDEVGLVYHSTLEIDSSTLGVYAEEVTLSTADFLSPSDSYLGVTSEIPVLLQQNILYIDDALIGVTSSDPDPWVNTQLFPSDALISTSPDNVNLHQNNILDPQSALIGVAVSDIDLTQKNVLAPQNASIGIFAEEPDPNTHTRLSLNDAYVGWFVSNPELGIYQKPQGPQIYIDRLDPTADIKKPLITANIDRLIPKAGVAETAPQLDIEFPDIISGGVNPDTPLDLSVEVINPVGGMRTLDKLTLEIPEEAPSWQPESTVIDADDLEIDADADVDAGFTIISKPRAATDTTILKPIAKIEQPTIGWFN